MFCCADDYTCAVQIGSSIPSPTVNGNPTTNVSVPKVIKLNRILSNNSHDTVASTSFKRNEDYSNQNKYFDIIDHASELLPVMEESYQNSSDEIAKTKETLEDLEHQNLEATDYANQLQEELDNFEISTNNSIAYKKLQAQKKEYDDLKDNIKLTKESIHDLGLF